MSIKLNKRQLLAAQFLALGYSSKNAAIHCGVREETICRWKKITDFKNITDDIQIHLFDDLLGQQTAWVKSAQKVIAETLLDETISSKLKTSVALRYLHVFAANSVSFEDKRQKLINKRSPIDDTDEYMKFSYEIVKAFFFIKDLNKSCSTADFKEEVNKVIQHIDSFSKTVNKKIY